MRFIKKLSWMAGCLLFLFSCGNDKQLEVEKPGCYSTDELSRMVTQTTQPERVVEKLRLDAKVSYNPNAVVHYISSVGATITRTFVTLGDKVQKGQVLAEIQSAELNSITSELRQLQAKLQVAEKEWKAVQSFHQDNLASDRELVVARSEKEQIEAEIHSLQSNLKLFSDGGEGGIFKIKAARSGFIVENRMAAGLHFSADSDPLFTISDLDEVWVEMNIYAAQIRFVQEGMPLKIRIPGFGGKTFSAEVKRISSVMDQEKNVLKAWAVLENKEQFLRPGLHVEAIVESEKKEEAISLPLKAIVFHNDKNFVVVLNDCRPARREVELLYQDEITAYVKHGLEAGERVVVENVLLQFEEAVGN